MREPRRITNIEVREGNRKLRIVLAVVLLIIGSLAITAGVMSLLNKDTGWQSVEVNTQEKNCSANFHFQYQFSGSGANATAVHKQVSAAYSDACVKAYWLFNSEETSDTYRNVCYLNAHPNEEVEVDPVLYDAFAKLEGTRYLYLGPVYAHYDSAIFNASGEYVQALDPVLDAETKAELTEITAYTADSSAVNLELLGDNRVKLTVSPEYLAFAAEREINRFIDFHYMTNAFVIDYLAQTMEQAGFTQGYLVSADGFTRNLDNSQTYAFNLFDRVGEMVYPAGIMRYQGPVSLVFLKDYPTSDADLYYQVSGDHFLHPHADPVDGMYRASLPNLVSYSYELDCVDVLLQMLPSFVSENFSVPEGVFSIWCQDQTIFYNDAQITVSDLLEDSSIQYQTAFVQ